MKKLILILCLIGMIAVIGATERGVAITAEQTLNTEGRTFIRFHNTSGMAIACRLRDENGYVVFLVNHEIPSAWYHISGVYKWSCSYAA